MGENADALLLTEREVLSLLSFETAYAASEEAFRLVGSGRAGVAHNAPIWLDADGANMFGSMAAIWPEKRIAGFKWFNMFSQQQRGLPAMNGHVIVLSSMDTGAVRALVSGTPITHYRTAPGHAAVAAATLARRDSETLALIGCGAQGQLGLRALARVLPLREAVLWDRDPAKACAAAQRMRAEHPALRVYTAATPPEAARRADVVLTATAARTPLLCAADIPAGCTVVGLYSFNDLAADMAADFDLWLLGSRVTDQKSILESSVLRARGALPDASRVGGDLAAVLCGEHPGRTDARQRILYTHMGMAILDVVLAVRLCERARAEGIGRYLSF